jgi:hypothetical protein
MTQPTDLDSLLSLVHERLGGVGLDIMTFGSGCADSAVGPTVGSCEVRWRRCYDDGLGDECFVAASSLSEALRWIIAYEDAADAEDEANPE